MTWRPGSKTIFLPPVKPVEVPVVREATSADLESIRSAQQAIAARQWTPSQAQQAFINDHSPRVFYSGVTLTLSENAYDQARRYSPGIFNDVNVVTTSRKTGKTMHVTQEILRAHLLMND
jgi:hypothetical protein